jgi:SAM-dependent methyltransferase
MLGVQPGMRILDAGCESGAGSWLLAMLGARVTGVDGDPAAVAAAEATYGTTPARKGGSVRFETADLTDWQPPSAFDAVIVAGRLLHYDRPAGTALLRRLLDGLDIPDTPPDSGWRDGLFLHVPLTAGLADWAGVIRAGLLRRRLRHEIVDRFGDPAHRSRYGLGDLGPLTQAAGGRVILAELRAGRVRTRPIERALYTGALPRSARLAGHLLTAADLVLLPELVAALRVAPADSDYRLNTNDLPPVPGF